MRLTADFNTTRAGFELAIRLDIAAGQTLALLGPNGAGKSSTLAALAGLIPIDQGQVKLGERYLNDTNQNIFIPPQQRRIGVVFQSYYLFEHMTVAENVGFGAHQDQVKYWLEVLEIDQLSKHKPKQLSGGQAQRVALARALASKPAALILDEPLAAVDITSKTKLRRALNKHLNEFKGPSLLITHDPSDAFLLADKLAIIEDGKISQTGSVNSLRRQPKTSYAAALVGVNFMKGKNNAGSITLDHSTQPLTTAITHIDGPVIVTIQPNAIALHPNRPYGSPRNTWPTTISDILDMGDTCRIELSKPLPLSVDVTPQAIQALKLAPNKAVWASVKATEVQISPV